MEKYARQCLSEGHKHPEDVGVNLDAELYRVINLHYNRNNHIEVSTHSTVPKGKMKQLKSEKKLNLKINRKLTNSSAYRCPTTFCPSWRRR